MWNLNWIEVNTWAFKQCNGFRVYDVEVCYQFSVYTVSLKCLQTEVHYLYELCSPAYGLQDNSSDLDVTFKRTIDLAILSYGSE